MRSADGIGSSPGASPPKPGLLAFLGRQLGEVVPPTLFFAVGFNVIVLTIQLILFKTIIYCLVVLVVRIIEKLVKYWLTGGTVEGIPDYVENHFSWNRF